jgi:hypothetical protein
MEGQIVLSQSQANKGPTKVPNMFEAKLKSEFGIDYDKLQQAISILPKNYTFEVEKTICRILEIRK